MQTKRNIIIVLIIVAISAVIYYRSSLRASQLNVATNQREELAELDTAPSREVSAIVSYEVPEGEDKVRFILSLNSAGAVVGVKTTDVLKNEEVSPNLEKFSQNLLVVIKGKKLSELGALDKIGTSSLTTTAFNSALEELKSKI